MQFLLDKWRGIGFKLYLALGFAVLLTLVSTAVGIYYFERSGDLNYIAEQETVPVLQSAWIAAREAEHLRVIGTNLLLDVDSKASDVPGDSADESLARLDNALTQARSIPELEANALTVQSAAYDLAAVIDTLSVNETAIRAANETAADLKRNIDALSPSDETSTAGKQILNLALHAESEDELQKLWDDFSALSASGLDPTTAFLGGGDGVFYVRGQQLVLLQQKQELADDLDALGVTLDGHVFDLLDEARIHSSEALGLTVQSFDQGRLILTVVSIISVIAATLMAWLWVGNAVVRRLARLSERMRNMATGDLETPVPEVSQDEIGQLANALEVFRTQAYEVQRLNLVEKLYEELRVANAELQRMQAQIVAQQKLAALGELVSGVAHEISNPLNFVKNFSEGCADLYEELKEILDEYRDTMSNEDLTELDELGEEINANLDRIISHGTRALTIVDRMRGMGITGGDVVLADLNALVAGAVRIEIEAQDSDWKDLDPALVFDMDPSVENVPLVERDFGEAITNLVSNACFAMQAKRAALGDDYEPRLTVSSRANDNMVEVKIRDNGTGIENDVVERIFNPFFSTRAGALGAGLGLSIAADVAQRLGGDLGVDTVAGEYAEFTMRVAASADDAVEDNLSDEIVFPAPASV